MYFAGASIYHIDHVTTPGEERLGSSFIADYNFTDSLYLTCLANIVDEIS